MLLSGTWSRLSNAAPGPVGTMLLLPDGSVMAQIGGTSADWARLVPDSAGSYLNGSWTRLASMHDTRLYGASQILPSGNVFIAGGEYGTGSSTGETYNPLTNAWTELPAQSFGKLMDSSSDVLPDGRILIAPVSPSGSSNTILFDPSSNTWSAGPRLYRGGNADEQSWVKLADGSIITIDGPGTSERYIPSLNKWVNDGSVPVNLWDSIGEMGAGVLLADGRAFFIGASGHTAIYTPSGTSTPGSWATGPNVPNGGGQPDAPAAVLPDGTVLCAVGTPGSYNGPTSLDLYNPASNSFSAVAGAPTITAGPYVTRMLDLPDGSVLFTTGSSTPYLYNPETSPIVSARPSITASQLNSDGTYQLTGTGFNGISEGAYYGDDAQMNSNYPLVRLTGSGGQVYFARSFNWSSTGVQTGAARVTTDFALPAGIPADTYSASVMVNGFISSPMSITVPSSGYTTAPALTTAAQASPAVVADNTTSLSILGADAVDPESKLTYTWAVVSAPSGARLPSYSVNGTNAAQNTSVTFYAAGTYTFDAYVTDVGGLSTASTTTVTVSQTPTQLTVSPAIATMSGNATEQFRASATDQFRQPISSLSQLTWSVASGGGTIDPTGLYTAPATGTLATITVSSGVAQASATVGVDTPPWVSRDIGAVGLGGQSYDTSGTFTLQGSGAGIGGTADQFRFTYQSLSGNASLTARLIAQSSTNSLAQSGIMVRNSLNSADPFAMLAINPGSSGVFEYRNAQGAAAISSPFSTAGTPLWIRLVRNGNTLTGYTSVNGAQWAARGSVSISMNNTVYVGLEACSDDNTAVNAATFDNVSISQPSIAAAAAAGANPVLSASSSLSVQGADPAGESSLTYTWSAAGIPAGAATPTFSLNGSNAAKNTLVTFSSAGTYSLMVTVSDPAGLSATSVASVSVNPTVTSIAVSPPTASCTIDGSLNFGAMPLDQFGHAINLPAGLTWSVTGPGNSISSGAVTAGNTAGAFTVSASAGAVTGAAALTVNSIVAGRYLFYNDSVFDGSDPAADARDDHAIATDKQALLPGNTATFANYTSYSRGINGVMIDVAGLPGSLSASDVSFRVGNSQGSSGWATAPAAASILVRPAAGIGSSSCIEVTWPDGAIRNEWLQVTLLADAASGLASPDVFYFGNLVGSTGQPPQSGGFAVSPADVASARGDPHTFLSPAGISDINDFNRDGRVDALDQLIARMSANASLSVLSPAPPTPAGITSSSADLLVRRRRISL